MTFKLNTNEIKFNQVYDNGFHSLQQFEISNLTDENLCVQLDAGDLKNQVVFQLHNENINEEINFVATNTANTPQDFSQFNQVFNYVNHIHSIDLKAQQTQQFIIAFLPETRQQPSFVYGIVSGIIRFASLDYTLNVDFYATVCQSVLAADELDTGLIFEDSIVGETYIKDITIRNLSAIDLHWRLNTLDLSRQQQQQQYGSGDGDWLQFVDACTFMTLGSFKPIAPFSMYTFRVVFTPKEVGKFNYDLQIENINDVQNITQTKIHATIQRFMHRDTLVVSSGNILDFGDCIAGNWSMQQMVLNNVSESSIEVHFSSEGGAELAFNVKANPEDQELECDISNTPVISTNTSIMEKQLQSNTPDTLFTRPISPSAKTYSSQEEYASSINSYASTGTLFSLEYWLELRQNHIDVDIDMLTAFNELYFHNTSTSSLSTLTLPTKQRLELEENSTRIEDMILKPGAERIIQVSYRPAKAELNGVHAGQLTRQNNFGILLEYRPSKSAKPRELKLIQCKAKTCTSFVSVTPQLIDFGDTDVGTQKSQSISITNLSEICAHVELVFESKVISCTQGELLIQPKSTVELKLDIYPRKINTSYKRQIKLVNYLNRENDQIIEVCSRNVDNHKVTFHSLFYQLLTPTGANYLDFGPIALNSPAIRTCTLINVKDAPLLLGISTSLPEEIVLYTKKKRYNPRKLLSTTPSSSSIQRFEQDIEKPSSVVTNTLIAMNHRTRMTNVQYASTAYLDLATVPHVQLMSIKHQRKVAARRLLSGKSVKDTATVTTTAIIAAATKEAKLSTHTTTATSIKKLSSVTGQKLLAQKRMKKKKEQQQQQYQHQPGLEYQCTGITATAQQLKKQQKNIDWPDIAGKAQVPLDDLISILEHGSLSRTPLFPRQSSEEQFVKYQLAWRTELDRLIEKEEIVPVSLLQLDPKEETEIIIVYTPRKDHWQSSLTTKKAAALSIRLIDFEHSSDEDDEVSISDKKIPAVRKVIVRAQVCKSSMEVGQRNINFGLVDKGEKHHKTIVLHNKSETPLLYTIKKSGSIASGAIYLDVGRHGVIRAFGKREIDFVFVPTLHGPFIEQLTVCNIRDKEDTNVISLKAMVRRPESFQVKALLDPLSIYPYCKSTCVEILNITNTNQQSRTFEIRIDNNEGFNDYHVEFNTIQQESTLVLNEELEEEIETIEQKLKIAVRKDQPDKIKKYSKKLAKLKHAEETIKEAEEDVEEEAEEEQSEETPNQGNKQTVHTKDDAFIESETTISSALTTKKLDNYSMLFTVGPHSSSHITAYFRAYKSAAAIATTLLGRILIYEHKNLDTVKSFPFTAALCTSHESCLV
ncbi:hypothetical protein HMPREF1544_00424 [Mucor circinelloides 1006PhL]|uniref:MSP domain-containing protein n=1 Tax=Mucor circinelloides f. circinelloides (strain 1006PhL) TaxID=1220926 RepID=S2KJV0_MUCC1|nr:hypothetical protein HMPREF1544_00424 [Mucor circinelloides 1006PhL]